MTTNASPVAQKRVYSYQHLGREITDDYRWMHDKNSPELISYLEAENNYTSSKLKHTLDLQDKLYREMLGRIIEDDSSAPVFFQGYWYYTKTQSKKAYPIYCRKHKDLSASEQVLLDLNILAEGKQYLKLGCFKVSPDQTRLIYGLDENGSENFSLYLKDFSSDTTTALGILDASPSLEWHPNGQEFYYVQLDHAKRPHKLLQRNLVEAAPAICLYHEEDESYFVSLHKSKDKKYLFVHLHSQITSEVRYICWEQQKKEGSPELLLIQERQSGHEYSAEHHRGEFYILTNRNECKNFKLVKTNVEKCNERWWQVVREHQSDVKLEDVELFESFYVLSERQDGLTHIRICNYTDNLSCRIDQPEVVYTVEGETNPEYRTTTYRYRYNSPITASSVLEYDVHTRQLQILKQQEVPGYNKSDYECQRVWVDSHDGARVPMTLMYKRPLSLNAKNPLFLYGYGSYGICIDPEFSSSRISLMDRGFVCAIAHIRGGSELGRQWYEDGKFLNKKNTFLDFIACAEYLIREKWTCSQKLVMMGGSAGGMLMGAVLNMRPELFRAAIAKVPFVDVINTMLDPSLPLTVIEYDEWGNPNDKKYFEYMLSYSPYDNVKKQAYPRLLVTSGINDPRVQYWEPSKWVAKLRQYNNSTEDILLKMDMGSGHGGKSGRYEYLKEVALDYAFYLDSVGINQ